MVLSKNKIIISEQYVTWLCRSSSAPHDFFKWNGEWSIQEYRTRLQENEEYFSQIW